MPQHQRMKDIDKLTPREREVLKLLAGGDASKVIADKLGISENTVEVHRKNIYGKMGVHSAAQAVLAAVRMLIL